ncbi:MAG: M3 family metallopeptidase [Vicinamibacterales bacterium]
MHAHAAGARLAAVRLRRYSSSWPKCRRRSTKSCCSSSCSSGPPRGRTDRCCSSTPSTASSGRSTTRSCSPTTRLEAHRMVERDEPVTADALSALYAATAEAYWGDALHRDDRTAWTWARIPHFFQAPYYVYQYATCMASTAALMEEVGSADPARRDEGVRRYLDLLRAGGSDHPMALLARAGVDLAQPTAIRALVARLDRLVGELEAALA